MIAIVVSVGSVFATLYFQYFERPHVAVALGDEIYLNYGEADDSGGYAKLGMVLSLSLINSGACDALVTMIAATVRQAPGGFQTQARWRAFYEPTDAGTPGESPAPVWKFNGWVRPLAATSRKVVTEWIYFRSTPLQSALPVGGYVLELEVTETRPAGTGWSEVTEETDRRALARWVGEFMIDEQDATHLESKCIAVDGLSQDSRRVELRRRLSSALWST
jgi:hypothetical protein